MIHTRISPGSVDKLGRPTIRPAEVARRFRAFLLSNVGATDASAGSISP